MSRDTYSSSVSAFYAKKSVFITGGTGFIGKVLIEKLLYSCEEIDKIFILLRKSDKSARKSDRLKNLLQNPVFTRLHENKPQAMDKVIPVLGNLAEPRLGISAQDEATLQKKVSVVFHLAATIRFAAPLREAMVLNVEATRQVLELSQRMTQLQAFVHVSTAFCNFSSQGVDEVVYPPPASLAQVYKVLEKPEPDEKEIQALMGAHPNTYTFTKALAENLVADLRGTMPVVIVRPSVVLPSMNEPFEAYVDNLQGAVRLLIAYAKGYIWAVSGSENNAGDFIPVDYVANTMIVAASQCPSSTELAVYNCCTSAANPVTWTRAVQIFRDEATRCGYREMPSRRYATRSSLVLAILTFLTQTIPAHVMDWVLFFRGQEPKYVKMQSKLIALLNAMRFFVDRSWRVRSERAQALAALPPSATLPPSAAAVPPSAPQFPCNPADIDWESYLSACLRGVLKIEEKMSKLT